MTQQELYTPPLGLTTLPEEGPLRVGIQGAPGSGKTAAALSFPNPVVVAFEQADYTGILSLPHLQHVKPIIIPFYDPAFTAEKMKMTFKAAGKYYNRTAALIKWLQEEAPKLTPQQTLIFDSWTTIQDAFDQFCFNTPHLTAKGEEDAFAPWQEKIEFSNELCTLTGSLKCNTVTLFHEVQERDKKTGELLDKLQPLMQGKFVAKLKIYWPNFFRQSNRQKLGGGVDGKSPLPNEREYVWQVRSLNNFDAKCSKPWLKDTFCPSVYQSLVKPSTL